MPNRMQNAIRHFMFTVQSKICWVIRKYCGKITKDCFLTSKNWIALLFMILMCYLSCLFNSRGRLRGGAAITFFGFSRGGGAYGYNNRSNADGFIRHVNCVYHVQYK